jgi:site-specific DNA recombinase
VTVLAAIYARKSTSQDGVSDEKKSVTRQIDHARAYAATKGWTVDEASIFVDDGISGADFTRKGFLRLMNSLKPRPPFQVLIMSEESRLGREAIETAYALKQIVTAGVRVFFYMEHRERTLDSPTDKIMLSLTAFADELEREKARQRTYDTMARKARALHVTGGRVYGYYNIEVHSSEAGSDGRPRRLHVIRQVNPEQAEAVRRIFTLSASGMGITRIAKTLNADGVAPPRRAQGWAPTAIREILYRPLYRGEVVWNRIKKRDEWGVKKYTKRPEGSWLRQKAPGLRIVPDELWQAAHARLEKARTVYVRAAKGNLLVGRPANRDFDSPYLLSGIARCASCGGGLVAFTRDYKRQGGRSTAVPSTTSAAGPSARTRF